MPNRATFIVDGFNLYHSVVKAADALRLGERGTKWLDLRALCEGYLHLLGGGATLDGIFYFSAYAHHMERSRPGTVNRHRAYIRCLEDSGVTTEMFRFKKKERFCSLCKKKSWAREEKETDVALAAKLFERLALSECDSVVLVTGDTDIAPAVRTARRLYPACKLFFLFPYGRMNDDLKKLADGSAEISKQAYRKHQFPDPYTHRDGSTTAKPATW